MSDTCAQLNVLTHPDRSAASWKCASIACEISALFDRAIMSSTVMRMVHHHVRTPACSCAVSTVLPRSDGLCDNGRLELRARNARCSVTWLTAVAVGELPPGW
jgi:hypothetical protein